MSHKLPPPEYGLHIPDSEVVDRSEWGPIDDGKDSSNEEEEEEEEEDDAKSTGRPDSIDIKIPTKEEEKSKRQLEKLAEQFPTLSRSRSHPGSSRLPPITTVMATQTTTEPVQTFATEGEASSARRGRGPPDDAPDPQWFTGSGFPYQAPRGTGGGGSGGDGGGGGPPGVAGNPINRNNGTKLSGKEPAIFKGDCSKAEAFLLEWTIYRLLNGEQDIMRQAFSRVMLFLTFIKGPDVQEWASLQVSWLGSRIIAGAGRNEEYLYDTVMDSFNTAFTDTMSLQKAKAEFRSLKMEKGELDAYIAKFERLARIVGYNLRDQMVLDRFGSGLNPGLFTSIINNTDPHTWLDWTRAAQKYQQKYLLIRSALGMKNPDSKTHKKPQTPEQWKAAWNNKKSGNPDTMDTTPGHARVRRIDADERAELIKAGKCFTCKKQGHLSRDCPQRPPQHPCTGACASTSSQIEDVNSDDEEPAKVRSGKNKPSASEIMDILREADEEAKDSIIQDFFMKENF